MVLTNNPKWKFRTLEPRSTAPAGCPSGPPSWPGCAAGSWRPAGAGLSECSPGRAIRPPSSMCVCCFFKRAGEGALVTRQTRVQRIRGALEYARLSFGRTSRRSAFQFCLLVLKLVTVFAFIRSTLSVCTLCLRAIGFEPSLSPQFCFKMVETIQDDARCFKMIQEVHACMRHTNNAGLHHLHGLFLEVPKDGQHLFPFLDRVKQKHLAGPRNIFSIW